MPGTRNTHCSLWNYFEAFGDFGEFLKIQVPPTSTADSREESDPRVLAQPSAGSLCPESTQNSYARGCIATDPSFVERQFRRATALGSRTRRTRGLDSNHHGSEPEPVAYLQKVTPYFDGERLSPSRIEHRNVARTARRRHTQSIEPLRNEATFSERA